MKKLFLSIFLPIVLLSVSCNRDRIKNEDIIPSSKTYSELVINIDNTVLLHQAKRDSLSLLLDTAEAEKNYQKCSEILWLMDLEYTIMYMNISEMLFDNYYKDLESHIDSLETNHKIQYNNLIGGRQYLFSRMLYKEEGFYVRRVLRDSIPNR